MRRGEFYVPILLMLNYVKLVLAKRLDKISYQFVLRESTAHTVISKKSGKPEKYIDFDLLMISAFTAMGMTRRGNIRRLSD